MKITAIETIRIDEVPNLIWLQLHTDEGLVGIGESYFDPAPTETHIHERIAPFCWVARRGRSIDTMLTWSAIWASWVPVPSSAADQWWTWRFGTFWARAQDCRCASFSGAQNAI